MNLIKLDQIDSTNLYLKQLNKTQNLENFTTIYTDNQTHGRGQMGNNWVSEKGKNITFSTLIVLEEIKNIDVVNLNMMTAVSIVQALKTFNCNHLNIKWPNDIILKNKKIGGILIEQSKNLNQKTSFIIGIGLNVQQKNFKNITNASSIEELLNLKINKNLLLISIVNHLKNNFKLNINFKTLYISYLYKINIETTFMINNQKQIGKIIDVSTNGKLIVAFQNQEKSFGIKEIEMLY